jgi:hypothetical protein
MMGVAFQARAGRVSPGAPAGLHHAATIANADWDRTDEVTQLLAELDASERSSDLYLGWGWGEVARSFAERCEEIEAELDSLRIEAVNAVADATGHSRDADEWIDAWTEADNDLETVERACQRARKLGMGDGLIERAAAA